PKGFIAPKQKAPPPRRRPAKARSGGAGLIAAGIVSVLAIGVAAYLFTQNDRPVRRQTTTIPPIPPPVSSNQKHEKRIKGLEAFARDNPDKFSEIVQRFDALIQRLPKSFQQRARNGRKIWDDKWKLVAMHEVGKRKLSTDRLLSAEIFNEAYKVWAEFPAALMHPSVRPEIENQKNRIGEAEIAFVTKLHALAAPLLSRKAEELSADEVETLKSLIEKASLASGSGLQQADSLRTLASKGQSQLEAYDMILIKRKAEEKNFWKDYVRRMKEKDFDAARKLLNETTGLTAESKTQLLSDTDLVASFDSQAKANLPKLIGKWIRIRGAKVKVSSIREDRIYAKKGPVELGIKIEKLDKETYLSLILSDDPKRSSLQRALHIFYFGIQNQARLALREAAD
ncbi:MAG: hypothetical protein QF886_25395, partial [Planctomycetota bacterium]|nr:hypothetical protein [Planctomycetota bacterium]